MANTYTFIGTGTRWAEDDGTFQDFLNVSRNNVDHLHEALNAIMDSDAADGILQPKIQAYLTKPFKVLVEAGTTWTSAFWQSSDGRWWWLWNTANPASFARGDAEFYIPTASLADVPTS